MLCCIYIPIYLCVYSLNTHIFDLIFLLQAIDDEQGEIGIAADSDGENDKTNNDDGTPESISQAC